MARITAPLRRSRRPAPLAFDALSVEGALIAPALLAQVARFGAGSQTEADYGVPKGLTLRDEIARYFRIGQALYAEFAAARAPSQAATVAFAESLLREVLGVRDLVRVGSRELGERVYALTMEGLGGRLPVVIAAPEEGGLDRPTPHLPSDGRRVSPASAVQDWLNATKDALWGFACNGHRLRLMRDNASLTRPAFIEADLARIFESDLFSDFAALWLLVHASRFGAPGTPVTDCALERWREAGAREGAVARERLREGVEAALLSLGSGFLSHPANAALRERLTRGDLALPDYFGQCLRLVYRLIFLFAAEDRSLLHPADAPAAARQLYAEGYALGLLRQRAVRRSAFDQHHDRWEGLLVVFAGLVRGEPRLGLPALDGLFAYGTLPDLEGARLANRDLMRALYRLAWLDDEGALVPVNWRDMETEELGSVYESLLELTPRLTEDGRGLAFAEGAETKGNARKTTGSYYTPDSLVQVLLDSALDPVLDRVTAEAEDPAAALLSVTVIDPACGSGHFLLAAARRIATRLARLRTGGIASAEDFRHALRDVVRACIHGVDRNPMAVELTKVALWIETIDPGLPLGFLDANIRCGDALLGVFDLTSLDRGIPDAAYKPLSGDDPAAAKVAGKVNRLQREQAAQGDLLGHLSARDLAREAEAVRAMPEDDVAALAAKAAAYSRLRAQSGWGARKRACDLYVVAFLRRKSFRTDGLARAQTPDRVPTSLDVRTALTGGTPEARLCALADTLAQEARAFHWPLEFPVAMARGGFDAVLGNPPWERIKLQEQEFFATLDPEITGAPNAAARGRLIAALKSAALGTRERALHDAFEAAKRTAEAASVFARVPGDEGGRFELTGRGDVNTYALFAELFLRLASPRGRAGVIVPTGIATDSTTAPFFAALVAESRLAQLIDFENRDGIFPSVHRSFKFSLLTIGSNIHEAHFAFFLNKTSQIADYERKFALKSSDIARINPNTQTAPIFRSRIDADLTAKIYSRSSVLHLDAAGRLSNHWEFDYITKMFDMTYDSKIFFTESNYRSLTADEMANFKPLYEAKMVNIFDHRWSSYASSSNQFIDTHISEKSCVDFDVTPRYYASKHDLISRMKNRKWKRDWLIGWRNITNSTNERTIISAVIPHSAVGNTFHILFVKNDPRLCCCFVANLNTIVFDYVARQKLGGTHLTIEIAKQLPVLLPDFYGAVDLDFIVPRVLELTFTSHALAPFARDLGYDGPPFVWNEDRRAQLRAELDAWYAHAYGLTRDELRYVLDPADVKGPEYPSETFRVLKKNEEARFDEYRTRRLVLTAYDRLAQQRIAAE
ncbi:Eco57I restriction-modification methylase domain-containing protein [Methylobacterium sp. SyP6R]|uniref:Eco57I restriction-modification methylase domain-containing protein n=1 Tax=Methylobacterium sp. SyP6R TaxID=2718876 RepID=UPI001F015E61|nr:N-6 DNA methylase [Methylobacterium sp. SyP6R]MCF4127897.1 N-6 DNA methylase [Methylobacterium sp. SyP6R]